MYTRFFDEFAHAGEFNIPFDRTFLATPAFAQLTDRLHRAAAEKYRDSWVACDACDRWREIPSQSLAEVGAKATWRCKDAFPALGRAGAGAAPAYHPLLHVSDTSKSITFLMG